MGCPSCLHSSTSSPAPGPGWGRPPPASPSAGPRLTVQEVLVRVRTQGRPGTPTPEDHGLAPQEVGSEARVQLPTWGGGAESGEEGSRHPFPRTSAGSHPPCAHPALSITHLRRCWRRAGWAHAGTAPAHSQHCGPPGEVRAGEREAGCHWESSTSPPRRAVAIMHRVQLESGGGGGVKPPSIQGLASGVSSGTKAPFRPLKPLPRPRLHGEGSGA